MRKIVISFVISVIFSTLGYSTSLLNWTDTNQCITIKKTTYYFIINGIGTQVPVSKTLISNIVTFYLSGIKNMPQSEKFENLIVHDWYDFMIDASEYLHQKYLWVKYIPSRKTFYFFFSNPR